MKIETIVIVVCWILLCGFYSIVAFLPKPPLLDREEKMWFGLFFFSICLGATAFIKLRMKVH